MPSALVKRPANAYAPGPVRHGADREHSLAAAFVDRHPEYARLSHLELVTLAATYRSPADQDVRDALEDEGVPMDWHRPDDFVENPEAGE
jgi:hypothetical protein